MLVNVKKANQAATVKPLGNAQRPARMRPLSTGQIRLLRFLADEGEQPVRIVPASYQALIVRGLILRAAVDKPYFASEAGRALLDTLKQKTTTPE